MTDKISRYYFRDLMSKVQVKTAKWTVDDVFSNPQIFGHFKAMIESNPRVFRDYESETRKIFTAIRLGGAGYAKFPTQFPMRTANAILRKYNINGNYYDFSCGWGTRLLSSLTNGINYFGTDPNYLLVERLNALAVDYRHNVSSFASVDIRSHGSQFFVPEWENTMGLAFSSPPYFDLEDYKIGDQSYTPSTTYDEWLSTYLRPTITHIYQYLIDGGICAINIKNIPGYPCADDANAIIQSLPFNLIAEETLHQERRTKSTGGKTDSTHETIFVYRKH